MCGVGSRCPALDAPCRLERRGPRHGLARKSEIKRLLVFRSVGSFFEENGTNIPMCSKEGWNDLGEVCFGGVCSARESDREPSASAVLVLTHRAAGIAVCRQRCWKAS